MSAPGTCDDRGRGRCERQAEVGPGHDPLPGSHRDRGVGDLPLHPARRSHSRHQAGRLPRRTAHRAPRGVVPGGRARGPARDLEGDVRALRRRRLRLLASRFHAPDGEYVTVEQSTQKRAEFIDEASQGSTATKATEEIGGSTWTRYTGGRYDALVLRHRRLDDGRGGHGALRAAHRDGEGAEDGLSAAFRIRVKRPPAAEPGASSCLRRRRRAVSSQTVVTTSSYASRGERGNQASSPGLPMLTTISGVWSSSRNSLRRPSKSRPVIGPAARPAARTP